MKLSATVGAVHAEGDQDAQEEGQQGHGGSRGPRRRKITQQSLSNFGKGKIYILACSSFILLI